MRQLAKIPWWAWIFALNLLFIVMTALFPYVRHNFLKWIVVNHFNLAGEMTLAAWWSGALLLLASFLALEQATRNNTIQHAWRLLALMFALLSFDEIGSLHERAAETTIGSAVLLAGGFVGLLAFTVACWQLWQQGRRRTVRYLVAGMALMASAILHEYLEHRLDWPVALQGLRVAAEEGSELMGMLLCLVGLVEYRTKSRLTGIAQTILPNRFALPRVLPILAVALVFHLLSSLWVAGYVLIEFRGNPGVWYFTAVFLLLGVTQLWMAMQPGADSKPLELLLAGYFLALSLAGVYFIAPRFNSVIYRLGPLANPLILLEFQVPLFALVLYIRHDRLARGQTVSLIAITLLLGAGSLLVGSLAAYAVSGVFAFVTVVLYWPMLEQAIMSETRRVMGHSSGRS